MSITSIAHFDLDNVPNNPILEEIVGLINNKTQNPEKEFFRVLLCYFFGKMAASMRVSINTKDRGNIPVNIYTVALATSGYGKGHSVSIIENELMTGFKDQFQNYTIPIVSGRFIQELAAKRAITKNTDEADEVEKATKEYNSGGIIPFTFDSGTVPAVKQLRHTLLMGRIGAVNLQIDEIASNLLGSVDLLTLFLELYDQGMVKQKLTKNTNENTRAEDLDGKTPSNMLLFGTPSKLFDGGAVEDNFNDFLEIGYARRSLFAMGTIKTTDRMVRTAAEIYHDLINPVNSTTLGKWCNYFTQLAEEDMYGWTVTLEDDEAIELLTYKLVCEDAAEHLADNDHIGKAELSHRYFKALKLAGAFAFIHMESVISKDMLYQAIKLVEESGKAFNTLRTRDKAYVRLAKYIAAMDTELTHADLVEALPFYKSSASARSEMMTLASAWGYKRHIVIRKTQVDGIELFRGETLKETDINEIMCAYSEDFAYNYEYTVAPFNELTVLATTPDIHWTNHGFTGGHRNEANVILGFNLIVIDVDGGVNAEYCHQLLKEYKHIIYTTKRSTEDDNRFRLLLPMNYILKLDADDYREFMAAITAWLPFHIDEGANQRSRKWLSNPTGTCIVNEDGELLDVMPFIPKTTKYEQTAQQTKMISSMDNLERWFANRVTLYGRNNQILCYALALKDAGMAHIDVVSKTKAFNAKLPSPLNKAELDSTVLVTLARRYTNIP